MMNICAVVKSSWSFVWLQDLGIFTLILASKTWLGEGGSGDASAGAMPWAQRCRVVTRFPACPALFQHWPLAVFAEMSLLLTAAGAPVSLSVSSSKLLHISLEPLSVLRCPRASGALTIWVFLVLCGFRGVLHLVQAQQGWYKAVTLLCLQERHFRGCWEQYWSCSVSLACLVHVMRF